MNEQALHYVPALPTLWPSMLAARSQAADLPPFDRPGAQYVYFARNAVWLGAKILGLSGREVLVPAYHHGVEVEALVDAGAIPRFYRVGPRWQVDPDDVARLIGPNTSAIYLTHFAGFPGPVAQLRALADRHGLVLIEDCALSLLSSNAEGPLGLTGDMAVYCLYKTLPVPHGGALVFNRGGAVLPQLAPPSLSSTGSHALSSLLQNLELRGGGVARAIRSMVRQLGRLAVRGARLGPVATGTRHFRRAHVELGMSPLALRIARAQSLHQIIETRRRNFFFLMGRLRDLAPPLIHELPAGVCPLFFPLWVSDKQAVMSRLAVRGVESVDFWRHFHPACEASRFRDVASLRRSVLELPCHQDLDSEAMAHVAAAAREAVRERWSARPVRAQP